MRSAKIACFRLRASALDDDPISKELSVCTYLSMHALTTLNFFGGRRVPRHPITRADRHGGSDSVELLGKLDSLQGPISRLDRSSA